MLIGKEEASQRGQRSFSLNFNPPCLAFILPAPSISSFPRLRACQVIRDSEQEMHAFDEEFPHYCRLKKFIPNFVDYARLPRQRHVRCTNSTINWQMRPCSVCRSRRPCTGPPKLQACAYLDDQTYTVAQREGKHETLMFCAISFFFSH